MVFGESKCAFLATDKGKAVESHEAIVINGVAIKPLKDGDSYKYLGQDENIGYVGPLKKARFFRERRAIAHACAHAHLDMSRRAKNCPPNKQ